MASMYNMTRLHRVCTCASPAAVGSKVIQPCPGMYASTQECASLARIMYCEVKSLNSPPENPLTMREGIPIDRSMTAMAEAKYSQWPCRRTKRKSEMGSDGTRLGSCSVYT